MNTYYTCIESPLGPLLLVSDGRSLTGLYMEGQRHGPAIGPGWIRRDDDPLFTEARRQLADYFAGALAKFDLPVAPSGTPFQRRVWEELRRIPYGATVSYGEIAARLGNPGAARAVGLANARNPIGVVIPCHRVCGAGGSLHGYSGGIARKEALLALEAAGTKT